MKSMWFALATYVLLLALSVLHMAWYFPSLPERMASHFGASGVADGFMPKAAFVSSSAAIFFGISALIVAAGALMQCLPASVINLPNKEYWLSPSESRRTRMWATGYLFWIADATALFFIGMNQATFEANLAASPRLGPMFFVWFGLYCVFMVAWCFLPFRRFRKPKDANAAKQDH